MGQGLGKNSPVVLVLGKSNYEALIERHGQWVRWRVATKCPCVNHVTQQPDLHCKKCTGLGFTYSYQPTKTVSQTVMVKDTTGIIEIDAEFEKCDLVQVFDNAGKTYLNAIKTGHFIELNEPVLPVKGVYVTVVMTSTVLQFIESAKCISAGSGYYQIEGLRVSKNSIEGLYHSAAGDIIRIDKIVDADGNVYEVQELRQDCIYIEPILKDVINEETGETTKEELSIAEPLTAYGIEWIPPFVFALLNQNLSKADEQVKAENGGDAVLTFPYDFDVSNDDVITVLSGTFTQKSVLSRKSTNYDVINAYFVEEIVKCVGKEREYVAGKDFLLVGTNYIRWLCEDAPEAGEFYSLVYKVLPTYKVIKSIPQIRTSENQRMPKKAVVKLYDVYGEARGVNRQ